LETADILPAIHAVFSPFGGAGVSRSETPKNQKAAPFGSASCRPKATASVPLLGLGFCFAKPQELETADIRAGLKQRPPCLKTAGILPAIHAVFSPFGGAGVSRSETPKNQKAAPFGSASMPARLFALRAASLPVFISP
jgi:hypothetical protein